MKSDLPESREAGAGRAAYFTVGSYNIHRCVGLDGKCVPPRIAAVLAEMDCDIIALQEVDNSPGEHAGSAQLDFLARTLQMTAIPGLRIVRNMGEYGNAVLTRLPVLDVHRHDLSYSQYEPRGAVDVDIDVGGGQPLRVIAAHLGLRRSERRFQWRRLMVALAERPLETPTVVLGDMNEWYRKAATLREAHESMGRPPSPVAFPSFAPVLALTRMWVRPLAALVSLEVHRTAATRGTSDHLPLKATIDATKLRAPINLPASGVPA
jgi:endonuclease/exonuclease/phosphatase family metal-dependent hydrolase